VTAIHLTDRDAATRARPRTRALTAAATAALRAPSVFNTQPWRWRIHDEVADLYADRERQLARVDPDGMLLTVSCGAALHHAATALEAAGHRAVVRRLPDPGNPDHLARISIKESGPPNAHAQRLSQAMLHRRTDRRPYADQPVPFEAVDTLVRAAEQQAAHLHLVPPGQVVALTVAACRAAEAELADPAYRTELSRWTSRPPRSGDGVPAGTAVPAVPRPVPVRDFLAGGAADRDPEDAGDRGTDDAAGRTADEGSGTPVADTAVPAGPRCGGIGSGTDAGARYAILFTDVDSPAGWLAAGEALSAVLLTAVAQGLAVAPMSDVVEVPATRAALRDLLAGVGFPVLALRIGRPADDRRVPAAPRRPPEDVVRTAGGGS
jgi:nitroreductase